MLTVTIMQIGYIVGMLPVTEIVTG